MNSVMRTILLVAIVWIFGWFILKLVLGVALGILHLVLPVVILGAIVYGLYSVFGRKALPGGRRTLY